MAVDRRSNNVVISPHAYREPITGVAFACVPGGVFEMGSFELTYVDGPSHWASVSSFWMARTPVTNEQYRAYVIQTGEAFPLSFARREFAGPQQPVVGVSWDEARRFCAWLSTVSGKPVALPTEAQWEYAARGPESLPYPWGEAVPTPSVTHYGQPVEDGHTLEVGAHQGAVGPFGHLQLLGNVWEWCLDEWSPEAYLTRTDTVPLNPTVHGDGPQRAVRGAGWQCTQNRVHSAHRCHNNRSFRGWATGFRVMIGGTT
jgi:formylglycine-generating enzyme required for sulfatase activity